VKSVRTGDGAGALRNTVWTEWTTMALHKPNKIVHINSHSNTSPLTSRPGFTHDITFCIHDAKTVVVA